MKQLATNDIISKNDFFHSFGLSKEHFHDANKALVENGLTNFRKTSFHITKLERAEAVLKSNFVILCSRCKSADSSHNSNTKLILARQHKNCQSCGGSVCKKMFDKATAQLKKKNIQNVALVGGFPKQVKSIKNAFKDHTNLSFVDGTKRLNKKLAAPIINKSDLIIIWCKTPVGHSATRMFKHVDNTIYIHSTSIIGFYSALLAETQGIAA